MKIHDFDKNETTETFPKNKKYLDKMSTEVAVLTMILSSERVTRELIKASTYINLAVEKMICHSTRAEKSDREMSFAYRQALKRGVSPDLLRSSQRKWEDEIRNQCNTVDCLVEVNSDRAYEINSM